ncbi:hypothetical protein RE6C_04348 [Rhodopirellula europaea 6C]|uniref:Uncharacterized protein n=1 Tax=Rhodopirellula europaea 6C TaxID=1263867 RepID=M2AD07_9BACT|nr:hypothetical protein RE6C_04348 [Rhodopirellula europaea 6C]
MVHGTAVLSAFREHLATMRPMSPSLPGGVVPRLRQAPFAFSASRRIPLVDQSPAV